MSKKRWKGRGRSQHQPVAKAEVLPPLDLGFLEAVPIATREWKTVQIVVTGCGGTGVPRRQGRRDRSRRRNRGTRLTLANWQTSAPRETLGALFRIAVPSYR